MEDTVVALRKREYRLHEKNTEPPEIATDNAKKIIDFLIKEKGVEDGKLVVNMLCVLGAGWHRVWEEALSSQSRPGVEVVVNTIAFDYNKAQINEFGGGSKVVEMMIGDEADNDILEEILEGGIDLFIPSNIPDWIDSKEVINFAEIVEYHSPLVVCVAGKRAYGGFGHFVDELRRSYKFDFFESKDPSYEAPHQAIGYLKDDDEDDD